MNKYEHIEYTPYGEYRIENSHAAGILKSLFFTSFAEQNSVSNRKVASFTGKERDEARTIAGVLCVGLYYYGARYLDAKTSRWLTTDPALGEYIPMAPVNDIARKHNQNLPGEGGIYNTVNFHLYHYAGNNPVKYIDPDGRKQYVVQGKYTMQTGGWGIIRNTKTQISTAGCAIVGGANFTASLGRKSLTPSEVNSKYVLSDGRMDFGSLGKDFGYSVTKHEGNLTHQTLLSQDKDQQKGYLTLVNVNYDSNKGDHWVGVKGIETVDGVDYIRITPTSDNDKNVTEGYARHAQNWKQSSDGTILVPVTETKRYINFSKDINNEN